MDIVGQLPPIHRHLDDVGAERTDGVGEAAGDVHTAVALDDDGLAFHPEVLQALEDLAAGLARRLPRDIQAADDGRAPGLRPARQDHGCMTGAAERIVEPGDLCGTHPRPDPDAGGEHHHVHALRDDAAGDRHGRVQVVERHRLDRRADHHIRAALRQHLRLLSGPAVAGDTDEETRQWLQHDGASLASWCFTLVSGGCTPGSDAAVAPAGFTGAQCG